MPGTRAAADAGAGSASPSVFAAPVVKIAWPPVSRTKGSAGRPSIEAQTTNCCPSKVMGTVVEVFPLRMTAGLVAAGRA